jgi:superfamily II DNA or RNA helicase
MKLTAALAQQVPTGSRSRGYSYFIAGAVRTLAADGGAIEATVKGSELYTVRLQPNADLLLGSCSCAFFEDRLEICKHIWAVILAAEAESLPMVPPGIDPMTVDLEPLNPDDDESTRWADDTQDWLDAQEEQAQLFPEDPAQRAALMRERWAARQRRPPQPAAPPPWRHLLDAIVGVQAPGPPRPRLAAGQLVYVIDVNASLTAGLLVIELMTRDRKKDGDWGKPRPAYVTAADVGTLPPGEERELLERLLGARPHLDPTGWTDHGYQLSRFRLSGVLVAETLPRLCALNRCLARPGAGATSASPPFTRGLTREPRRAEKLPLLPIAWDPGPPWAFTVSIRRDESGSNYALDGSLARDGERMEVSEPLLVLADDVLLTRTHASRLHHGGAFTWLAALRRTGGISIPVDERLDLVDALLAQQPQLAEVPDELRVETVDGQPRHHLRLRPIKLRPDRLFAEVIFDYDGVHVPLGSARPVVRSPDGTRAIRRDAESERRATDTLQRLGFRDDWGYEHGRQVLQLPSDLMPRSVRQLLGEGWHVEAEGRMYHQPGSARLDVRSGIDWFELHGHVAYGEQRVSLPDLLAALERGESFVALGDGTMGLLPEAWLRKQVTIARFGSREGDHLRFKPSQAMLLDALLAAQPQVTWDATFARVRAELQTFEGVHPLDPPATFAGALRGYQREGLGWLTFLRQFGFGGCLADDMGLGKTVMVLALLDAHREAQPAGDRRASLVVVPRSLVFNWRQEAARFTPSLRVLEYTGSGRGELRPQFGDADLIVTTYGTVRRDAAWLAERAFDYVVLDESQTIKNAQTAAAKACRLLNARHRLALSGTPVENHLGELWSLFEFLNPGLLGRRASARPGAASTFDEEQLSVLARGLRPFILRRTKEQVAGELPPKTEQTIYCELERPQRVLYDELRSHYRHTLLDGADGNGFLRVKLQVLEALLRLRQAACHPGLIDRRRSGDGSAKLDVIVPRITEAVEEGHKTLVFSQFTSLLAILRDRLDAEGIQYEYLDGRTRDRGARVERFQTDRDCRLFLISLKAGGLGLNLTAAEYVFLLDPWWNPAVEAQAIDRAHRIGQARHVFAYRLIARDTVEEKVLELQQRKRRLANAILTADNSLIRDLRREDLDLLLS